MRYSTFDRELIAAFSAIKNFRFFSGRSSISHFLLSQAISKSKTQFSWRQQRQLAFLSVFTTTFVHLPGHQNVVADTLSRPSQPSATASPHSPATLSAAIVSPAASTNLFPLPLCYIDIAKAQLACPSITVLQSLPSLHITSIPLSPQPILLGDVSTETFHQLIPVQFQYQIFKTSENPTTSFVLNFHFKISYKTGLWKVGGPQVSSINRKSANLRT